MDLHTKVATLDPAIGTNNLGDLIISDAIHKQFALRGVEIVAEHSTRTRVSREWVQSIPDSVPIIICGTNILNSDMPFRRWWNIDLKTARLLKGRVVLCGVGWWQYQGRPNIYTRRILNQALSRSHDHSVRDTYTHEKLTKEGIRTRMTSCPTLWGLEGMQIHDDKRTKKVIATITDYNMSPKLDRLLAKLLVEHYDEVAFWPQGTGDEAYIREICPSAILLNPTMSALDTALSEPCEYVGTRLHAGIRALQHGRRTHIIAVDNRATEMAKDTSLPVVARENFKALAAAIEGEYNLGLRLPTHEINKWFENLRIEASA